MRGQQPRTKCDQDERNGSGHENDWIACAHLEQQRFGDAAKRES
jgi:hypothetical protein